MQYHIARVKGAMAWVIYQGIEVWDWVRSSYDHRLIDYGDGPHDPDATLGAKRHEEVYLNARPLAHERRGQQDATETTLVYNLLAPPQPE